MRRTKKPKEQQEPPKLDPMLGDKTPAYVEWLKENDPAEFERRYADRLTHLGRSPRSPR